MFTTLVESRGHRMRDRKSTTISVIAHGVLIMAAIAVTTRNVIAAPHEKPERPIIFVDPHAPTPVPATHPAPATRSPAAPAPGTIVITLPAEINATLPPADINVVPVTGDEAISFTRGGPSTGETGGPALGPALGAGNGIVDAELADKPPFVLGSAPAPRYPAILRETGTAGHVTVRFVVDTLGHTEPGSITIVESSHALFADAVKNALPSFRFVAGEVGGRKVRTLVQMPFTFAIR